MPPARPVKPGHFEAGVEPSRMMTGVDPGRTMTGAEPGRTMIGVDPGRMMTGAEPGRMMTGAEPGHLETGGALYRRVRKGFALVELAHLGLLAWSLVITQVSGYDAPLWSGAPGVTAISGAFYALAAMIVLLLLWGLVSAAWAGAVWRRGVLKVRARG